MKRGSALLVVLGMLSFMVVSAVAFSAYMRYSRLPSSYLRRTSSSRLLVKAALAEAIDEIDAAIGNNPHPGIGSKEYYYSEDTNRRDDDRRNRNAWKNRVYLGTNNVNNLIAAEDTVSTLTLEGLAYIPPAIVNDVRYYSRRSTAGLWKRMPYDSGRYAFCAIDVSDHFDINSLRANVPRSSSPSNRVSLAYLFENSKHTSQNGAGTGGPAAWDQFMNVNFLGVGKVPLVSMADWNLAVFANPSCGLKSPFCEYINNSSSSFFGGSERDDYADIIRRETFITDSYFPAPRNSADDLDLMDMRNQPIDPDKLRENYSRRMSFTTFMENSFWNSISQNQVAANRMRQALCRLGWIALYDYLDEDNVPVSLALPTVERVPMICGIQPMFRSPLNLGVDSASEVLVPDDDTGTAAQVNTERWKTRTVEYSISGLDVFKRMDLSTLLAFPFAHDDGSQETFKIEGCFSLFLTEYVDAANSIGLRTCDYDVLHIEDNNNFVSVGNGVTVRSIKFPEQMWTPNPSQFSEERDALHLIRLTPNANIDDKFLKVTYKWKQTCRETSSGSGIYSWQPAFAAATQADHELQIDEAKCYFQPVDRNGEADGRFASDSEDLKNLLSTGAPKVKFNAAVWVRVKNEDGCTVDMVPACLLDDTLDTVAGRSLSKRDASRFASSHYGRAYPLMKFEVGTVVDLSKLSLANKQNPTTEPLDSGFYPTAVMVADPRYNFAPESWFSLTGQNIDEQTWLQKGERDQSGRDGDIFMQVSDLGYLQSVYELANLPRLCKLNEGGSTDGWFENPAAMNYTSFPGAFADTANNGVMWKTYSPFHNTYEAKGDDFLEVGFSSIGSGFKINPYSTSTNIIMAAFANTPHDWRCASMGDNSMTAEEFNKKYAWNEYSEGAKIKWEDLEKVAANFIRTMDHYKSDEKVDWEDVWRDYLEWKGGGGENNMDAAEYLMKKGGVTDNVDVPITGDSEIWNTDKKFLYGFWHDCFALRQQLFLVFVRAEPTMMGGGAVGQTPPSLGARAVALVWRDPSLTKDNTPHQTIVLFYRQFD